MGSASPQAKRIAISLKDAATFLACLSSMGGYFFSGFFFGWAGFGMGMFFVEGGLYVNSVQLQETQTCWVPFQ